ncbi:hypothetical protein DMUE_5145 [Dictyocoela muelleri]|nr:hypothetical protein DMUE_5145 [Dictyocoela muelleri]
MKFITMNLRQKNEIIAYIREHRFPDNIRTKDEKKRFKKLVKKFETDPDDNNTLLLIKSLTIKPVFFSEDEERSMIDYISFIHSTAGHPGRDGLNSMLKNKVNNFSRNDIMKVLRLCNICNAINLLNT